MQPRTPLRLSVCLLVCRSVCSSVRPFVCLSFGSCWPQPAFVCLSVLPATSLTVTARLEAGAKINSSRISQSLSLNLCQVISDAMSKDDSDDDDDHDDDDDDDDDDDVAAADDLCNKWKESCLETITRCAFR